MIVTASLTDNSPVAAMWKDRNRRAGVLHGVRFTQRGARFVADAADLGDESVARLAADPFVDVVMTAIPLASPPEAEAEAGAEAETSRPAPRRGRPPLNRLR